MARELGWNSNFDEGIRLLSKSGNWTGIRSIISMPTNYQAPTENSYFNFYIGINGPGQMIEAGVSYATNKVGRDSGWMAFINPENQQSVHSPVLSYDPGVKYRISLDLQIVKNQIVLKSDLFNLTTPVKVKSGAIKMIIAAHEDYGDAAKRKVSFDYVSVICSGVWDHTGKYIPYASSGVKFDGEILGFKNMKGSFAERGLSASY